MKALLTLMVTAALLPVVMGEEDGPAAAPAPGGKAGPQGPEAEAEAGARKPTRFLADRTEPYLAAMKERLRINASERGPFGLAQKPGDEPAFVRPTRPKVKKATPFEDVIGAVRISAVFASDQEFMVDATMYRQGQVVPLVADGREIEVRIEVVRSSGITFRNLESGEVIRKRLDLLPRGVMVGVGPDTVPGMIPAGGKRPPPLHVELNTPPPTP